MELEKIAKIKEKIDEKIKLHSKEIDEINTFDVEVDNDPTSKSFDSLYKKIYDVRGFLHRVVKVRSELVKFESSCKKLISRAEKECDYKMEGLMITDKDVMEQKNQDLRQAKAHDKMKDELKFYDDMNDYMLKSKELLERCILRFEDLKSTYEALSDQRSILEDMVYLGTIKRSTSSLLSKDKDEKDRISLHE